MKDKVDLIFGPELKDDNLSFYKEELIFWHSQNSESLDFSKKEKFANQMCENIKNIIEIKNSETEFVVRFADELSNNFNFFEAKDVKDIFESLKSFINHTLHATKTIEVLVDLNRLTFKLNISRRRIGKEFEGSLQDFAKAYKTKMESSYFNSAQCHYAAHAEGVEMIFIFENRVRINETQKIEKNNTREKLYEV
jgi:hypothetical protein